MKIDIAAHILPLKYKQILFDHADSRFNLKTVIETLPPLYDMDHRFKIMDKFEELMHVITLSSPAIEEVADPIKAIEMAKMANDGMAELVMKYPDRFVAAIASLPMNNIDASLDEIDRSIKTLKFRGIQINSSINDKPLSSDEFFPIYEKMSEYNLPIFIHPMRTFDFPDYRSEKRSKHMIFHIFGWPYETAAAMTRLTFSGVFDRYTNLRFVTHHCGGMVPFLVERIKGAFDHAEMLRGAKYKEGLLKTPIDYFKTNFYYDTAIYGNASGLMCGLAFCGIERLLFGTDMPYDSQFGERYTRQTIQAIDNMVIDDYDKTLIYSENAKNLLRLPI